ncbi:Peptide chain release factor PrfB1, chloroplastic [Vitis vinifera]|uniref:Peptide chain release factor PrfB1, chloroplastic n=1 Tax=Vitis vinifera TaxID=29760 RepID=A0A438GD84_VITVI|nr:Peptide chain release factor PrfB1, chloroplastic [Vitis vinifera]
MIAMQILQNSLRPIWCAAPDTSHKPIGTHHCISHSLLPSLITIFSPPLHGFLPMFLIVFFDLLDLTVLFASPESQLDMEVTTETSSEWAMQGVVVNFYTLRRDVEAISERAEEIRASAGLQQLEEELAALEMKAADSSFWA